MVMNEVLVPDWIKRIKAEDDLREAQDERDSQRQLVASMAVNTKGPNFWKQLMIEATLNTEGLAVIGLNGKVSNLSRPDLSSEEHCRIDVTRSNLIPAQVYVSMFYKAGNLDIRCHTSEGESFKLGFAVRSDNSVGVMFANDVTVLDEKEAAQMLVGRMVTLIRAMRS